jgi:hypothetical protein
MRLPPLAVAIASLSVAAATGHTQDRDTTSFAALVVNMIGAVAHRWPLAGGVSVVRMVPSGEFADHVGPSYGMGLTTTVGLEPQGMLRLRLSLSAANYGTESRRVPLSNTLGGRILVDVITSNGISLATIGPEIAATHGRVRPYAHAGISAASLSTDTRVSGGSDRAPHFVTHHFGDAVRAMETGAGARILVGTASRLPMTLDIGATRARGGRARFLLPGGITENPDHSLSFAPHESGIRLTTVYLGLSVGR